jgi:hypothetical protein
MRRLRQGGRSADSVGISGISSRNPLSCHFGLDPAPLLDDIGHLMMKNRFQHLVLIALVAGLMLPAFHIPETWAADASHLRLLVWDASSDDPAWNQALNVRASREGCSSAPESCVRYAQGVVNTAHVDQIFISVPFDTATAVGYAQQYSRLSLAAPWLREIGLDDFVGEYRRRGAAIGAPPAQIELQNFITAVKSVNPNLGFGITIYEDEINSPYLHDPLFAQRFRDRVDYVHLYLHYRSNGPAFSSYVSRVHGLFPKARIIAGAYAYDRQDYMPCAPDQSRPCTTTEESALVARTLAVQMRLLKTGEVDWLESYPGYLGREAQWPGWKQPKICAPSRQEACGKNSAALRGILRDEFDKAKTSR